MQRRDLLKYAAASASAAALTTLAACGGRDFSSSDEAPPPSQYANAANWLNLPAPIKDVDVFYVYPTAWVRPPDYAPVSCPIDYPMMRAGACSVYGRSATAFETAGNIFAPFYRQLDAAYVLSQPAAQRWDAVRQIPAKDVIESFDYFIKHLNQGRPFILAGHSQGSMSLMVLLSDYMRQHPTIYRRMVAAYIIGYPVTAQYMAQNPHLTFASSADDTGVIISYNVQSPNVLPGGNSIMGGDIGLVINPISWTTSEKIATTAEGLGSYMPDAQLQFSKVAQYADAQVNKAQGVLLCSTADEEAMRLISPFPAGVYHSFDYPFYYFNLRQNAENRARRFLGK